MIKINNLSINLIINIININHNRLLINNIKLINILSENEALNLSNCFLLYKKLYVQKNIDHIL